MKRSFTCCLMVFFFLSIGRIFAQENIAIKGKVTDASDGSAIPGVSVLVKGSTQGTQTDVSGNFTIQAPKDAILIISFIGYKKLEIPVAGRATIDAVLESESTQLDQVVVIGYGTAQKRDLTGSIVQIQGSEVADKPGTNPVANLQGKVAGVQVTNSGRPGAEPDIRIRGTNSINGSKPLYVVDGILNDNINFLNPADIESIEILKDPSSLAIFGIRGANGVIAVTTKKAKQGELTFNFNSTVGFKNVQDRMSMTDATGFRTLFDEQLSNEGSAAFDYTNWQGNTDWQDEIFQKGILNYNNLSVSGSTEKNKFRMGLGYINEEGIIKHEKLNRITINLNDELSITDHFRVGVNFAGYRGELPQERDVNTAIIASPIAPVFNEEYGLYYALPNFQRAQINNPMVDIELRKNTLISREYRAVTSAYAEVDFLKHFTFRGSLLTDYGFNESRLYKPLTDLYNPDDPNNAVIAVGDLQTSVEQGKNTWTKVQSDWLLTYKNSWGEHNLTATAGVTSYYRSFENVLATRGQGNGDPIRNDPRYWYVSIGAVDTQTATSDQWDRATLSYLGRVLYNYSGKYLLNASFRRDGSSAFEQGRWQNSGAVGAAWVLSEEAFLKDNSIINNLKVKGSWGVLANENTGDDLRYPLYPLLTSSSSAVFGNNIVPAYEPLYTPNPNLKWETVHAWEGGFELNAFNNKLYFEANYYNKNTKDILVQVPGAIGFRPSLDNAGEVRNRGFEFATSWNQDLSENWHLSLSGNITTINNEVLYVANNNLLAGVASRTQAGYPIGYFWGLVHDGIYQNEADIASSPTNTMNTVQPGDIKFKDVNEDGVVDLNDRTMIGNPTPDFTYGFSFNLSYKGFDFGTEFMGVHGNQILRTWNQNTYSQFNYLEDRLGRWNGEGTSDWEPIMHSGRQNNTRVSSYYIESGSFFRIRNIQLGYNFRENVLNSLKIKSLRVFANAQNPFTFANNTGFTPEIGGSAINFGQDGGTYPVPAIYTFGLNLNF